MTLKDRTYVYQEDLIEMLTKQNFSLSKAEAIIRAIVKKREVKIDSRLRIIIERYVLY